MAGDIVIRAEGVGKQYEIAGKNAARYETLGTALDTLARDLWQALDFRRTRAPRDGKSKFWSLRDVSFEIKRGEVIGIIGRNGAGKSTLLKILSRITPPTTGRIEITGRVASLLEVGTGFHPELTGRENIFLNGAILGMDRAKITAAFDDIVKFSGIGDFIDMPVKRYSSGMFVRLAFAVAAYVDPDILILDEVLAVGDAQFQKKCLAKIDEIVQEKQRTILIVSHGMNTISSMCDRVILLDEGKIVSIGPPAAIVEKYYLSASNMDADAVSKDIRPIGDDKATLLRASFESEEGENSGRVDIHKSAKVRMKYRLNAQGPTPPIANFHFRNSDGQLAFISAGKTQSAEIGVYEAVCHLPGNLLNNDSYSVDVALTYLHDGAHVCFYAKSALNFVVTESAEYAEQEFGDYTGAIPGALRPKLQWNFRQCEE